MIADRVVTATGEDTMYRSPTCGHCRVEPSQIVCPSCGLWICAGCAETGCSQNHTAWTGACRTCGTPYADAQRRDVLDDGDGEVVCAACGSRYRMQQLRRVEGPEIVTSLVASAEPCAACGRTFDAAARELLLVQHDQWEGRSGTQDIFHLLCTCGQTLATHTGPGSKQSRIDQ